MVKYVNVNPPATARPLYLNEPQSSSVWQPIDTAPATEWGKTNRLPLWSSQLGLCIGEVGNLAGYVWASVGSYHGNAVEHWGVTHWRQPLDGPSSALSRPERS